MQTAVNVLSHRSNIQTTHTACKQRSTYFPIAPIFKQPTPRKRRSCGRGRRRRRYNGICMSFSVGKVAAAFMVLSVYSGRMFRGWFVDSVASSQMSADKAKFMNMRKSKVINITVVDKGSMKIYGEGEVSLVTSSGENIFFLNVLYVPHLAANLVSVGYIDSNGGYVVFKNSKCHIYSREDKLVIQGSLFSKGIYKLNVNDNVHRDTNSPRETALMVTPASIDLWHRRLGHMNTQYLHQLPKQCSTIKFIQDSKIDECEPCALGKPIRKPFHAVEKKATSKLELVHSDVCYVGTPSIDNAKYFLIFLDDYSRLESSYQEIKERQL